MLHLNRIRCLVKGGAVFHNENEIFHILVV